MRKSSMDLTGAVRYKSLASACARLLATAMLAIGGVLFINESPITETAKAVEVKDIKPFDIKAYIKNQLSINNYQCLDTLATKESNWNFNAVNGSHHGFMQGRSKWLATATPMQQYDWTHRYVSHRYGMIGNEPNYCAALDHWKQHSWH
jgi:hypothetical protein